MYMTNIKLFLKLVKTNSYITKTTTYIFISFQIGFSPTFIVIYTVKLMLNWLIKYT